MARRWAWRMLRTRNVESQLTRSRANPTEIRYSQFLCYRLYTTGSDITKSPPVCAVCRLQCRSSRRCSTEGVCNVRSKPMGSVARPSHQNRHEACTLGVQTRVERPGVLGRDPRRTLAIRRTGSSALVLYRPNMWTMRTDYSRSPGVFGVTGSGHAPSSQFLPNDLRSAATQAYAERAPA